MSDEIETLYAVRRRGTFLVVTESGAHYYLELLRNAAGGVRIASSNPKILAVCRGTVGGCYCTDNEPVVRRYHRMHLVKPDGHHIMQTSLVVSITKVDDGMVDLFMCPRCSTGYQEPGQPCRLCRYNPAEPEYAQ